MRRPANPPLPPHAFAFTQKFGYPPSAADDVGYADLLPGQEAVDQEEDPPDQR